MPLKLNVGVSRKVGLPDYGSAGASCNLELELDSRLLETDLDGLHAQIRSAYVAAQQAVSDELVRLQAQPTVAPVAQAPTTRPNGDGGSNGHPPVRRWPVKQSHGTQSGKPATANQVKAIAAIARRQHADLEGLLRDGYGVARAEELTLAEASRLIDELKAVAEG
jgi:hypothetical protein